MRRLFDGDEFLRDGKGHKNNLLIDVGVNRFSVKGLTAFLHVVIKGVGGRQSSEKNENYFGK